MAKKKSESELIEINRKKGIDGMTDEQIKAVKETERHLSSALQMIFECQDMYMSDIRNLEQSMWDLRRSFNLGMKDW